MATKFTWYGHASWLIETAGKAILVDPYFDDRENSPIKAKDTVADYILLTHGHFDHTNDAAKISIRTGATCVANFEICSWLNKQGVKRTEEMNTGGSVTLPFGKVKSTVAHHSSSMPDGSYGGNPNGYLITLATQKIYIAGDTALFSDMALYGGPNLDLAILPIGDRYTMGPEDALEAVKLLSPKHVAPSHYNTWPPIAQDAEAWGESVRKLTGAEAKIVEPGGSFEI